MGQEDASSDDNASIGKKGLSRRTLLKSGGLLGLGALFAGISAFKCSTGNEDAVGHGNETSASNEEARIERKGSSAASTVTTQVDGLIIPGDELAQDLLLVLCPERLACLVYEPSKYLVDEDVVSKLPVYSELAWYLRDDLQKTRFDLLGKEVLAKSNAVLTVNALDMGVDHAVAKKFSECTGLICLDFSLEVGGWSALLNWLSKAVNIDISDEMRSCFASLDDVQADFEDSVRDRFSVLFCKGVRGDVAYGNCTSLAVCLAFAQCDYPELSRIRETCFYLEDSDMYGACPSDLVFFGDKKSYRSYLSTRDNEKWTNFSAWVNTSVDATGDVLPGAVFGCDWIDGLPVLLQLTLASEWLAGYLYPFVSQTDASAVVKMFNAWLYQPLKQRPGLEPAKEALDKRSSKTVDETRSARRQYKENMQKEMDELWDETVKANQVTPEKLKEIEEWADKEKKRIERERSRNKKLLGSE